MKRPELDGRSGTLGGYGTVEQALRQPPLAETPAGSRTESGAWTGTLRRVLCM